MSFSPIHTALCSFGMSGSLFHAPFLEVSPKYCLYGALERTKNQAVEKYPKIKTFRTLESLLADDSIELVIVNTPNITHYDFTKQILNAGKNVVVEKPFTVTVSEAEELIELAKAKKVVLSVYHNRRYDSDFLTVEKILKEGLLGDIVDVIIQFDRFVPELSYKVHKETPTVGVGSLYDLGSHLIDQALQLFGMPNAVFADLDCKRPNSKVVDYFDLKLYYESHKVTLKSSYFVKEALPGYVFHGTKGSFIKTKGDVQETDLQGGKTPNSINWGIESKNGMGLLHTEKDGKIIKEYIPSLKGNYMDYYDALSKAIRNNATVPVSATEGMQVIQIIEAAIASNRERKVIDL